MPKGTLLDLANEMDNARILIKLRARELSKFVTLRMIEYLLKATPADVSTALSNWQVSVAGTSYGAGAIPAYVPGEGGSTREASAAAALEAAKAALRGAQAGKAIAIINTIPYIRRLNEGSSSQAPAGFIEEAILVGRMAVKEYNFNRRLAQDIRRGTVTPDG